MFTPPAPERARRSRTALFTAVALLALLGLASSARASAPSTFFGVSAVQPEPGDFATMSDIGIGSVRVPIVWPSVQKTIDGPYNWTQSDKRVRRAVAFGLEPLPILFGTPDFINGGSGEVHAPLDNSEQRQAWQDFVAAATARYGPLGDFWTESPTLDANLAPNRWLLWNEVNARYFWTPKPSPSEYAKLIRISRRAIDTVDPSIKLVTGGIYGFPHHGINAKKYLRKLYEKRGVTEAIAGVSIHPYAKNVGGVKEQVEDTRKVMRKAGEQRAFIYIGEIGWASAGPKRSFLVKDREKQAKLLKKAYRFLLKRRQKWHIRGAFWYTWQDYPKDPNCNWCAKAGLFDKHGNAKPSGRAYKRLIGKNVG